MAFNEQSQPKVEATFRTHNFGSPTNQQQKEEEEEEQTFIPPPNDYPSSIGAIVAVNEPHNANINTKIKQYQCDSYPEGYRFAPHDYELIVHYLKKKLLNQPLPHDKIREVNLYKHNPDYFTAKYEVLGERDWYFFTPRDRKYLKGSRPSRKAGDGYWKATGADKPIKMDGDPVGYKKSLVFYLGKPPKGDKTDWIMHEFRVDTRRERENANDMRLDDWVLCRVYKKSKKSKKAKQQNQPEQNKYSVAAAALSEERAPPCVNDNGIADMNCDYNSSMGDSNQFINSYSDWFRFPPPKEALPDFSGRLPNKFGVHDHPTSHIQSTFQNEFRQTPQFSDCCLQNFSVPPHHPTSSFNYGTTTIGPIRPFRTNYMEEEHGLDSRTREPPQDDDWNMWKLDKNLASQDLSFPSSVEPFPTPNVPGPSMPTSM